MPWGSAVKFFVALGGFVALVYTLSRVPYSCEPYEVKEECGPEKLIRVYLYENATDRHPMGVSESHCVVALPGRIRATTGRLLKYDKWTRELRDVEYFDEYEFPLRNTEVCEVR